MNYPHNNPIDKCPICHKKECKNKKHDVHQRHYGQYDIEPKTGKVILKLSRKYY